MLGMALIVNENMYENMSNAHVYPPIKQVPPLAIPYITISNVMIYGDDSGLYAINLLWQQKLKIRLYIECYFCLGFTDPVSHVYDAVKYPCYIRMQFHIQPF